MTLLDLLKRTQAKLFILKKKNEKENQNQKEGAKSTGPVKTIPNAPDFKAHFLQEWADSWASCKEKNSLETNRTSKKLRESKEDSD